MLFSTPPVHAETQSEREMGGSPVRGEGKPAGRAKRHFTVIQPKQHHRCQGWCWALGSPLTG